MLNPDPTSENMCGFTVKCPRDSRDMLLVCGQQAAEFKSEQKIKHMALSPGLLFLSGWERIHMTPPFLLTLTSSELSLIQPHRVFTLTSPSSSTQCHCLQAQHLDISLPSFLDSGPGELFPAMVFSQLWCFPN